MANDLKLATAVKVLVASLKNDEDYYRGWKDNIAVAFIDSVKDNDWNENLQEIAVEGAEIFLDRLINCS